MSPALRALIVEDSEIDAALLIRELRRGYELAFRRVQTPEDMQAALEEQAWDVVISDYSMPRFSAPSALALIKEKGLDLPFIIVSGTVGEETAVAAMRAGAHDFMPKGSLGRLLAVIERELREVANRAERQKVREQLKASERRYRNVIDLMQEAIWIHRDGIIVFANPAAAKLFGADAQDLLIGRSIFSLVHPDDMQSARERTRLTLEEQKPIPIVDLRFVGLDGQTRTAALHALPMVQDGKIHSLVCARDVTALRQAEAQLHQAQKMESVGQLTGGIAHDFNNLLTVVIGSLDLALGRLQGEAHTLVYSALRASERGAAMVRQLLAFSRRQALLPETLSVNDLATGMGDLLQRTLGETIAVEMKTTTGLWPVRADKGQLESVLLNLAINARDAMPQGGKLTIETANAHLDEDYAAANGDVMPGDYAMLAVTDTGTGMPPEVIARACEPFFTTKGVGKGTGLGLSMIYGFAKQSGGHLKIYSEVGHGTTIRLYLPRIVSGEVAAVAAAPPEVAHEHRGGGETILVVEDDPDVRAFVLMQLSQIGYRVIEAADGLQARQIIESEQPIDLLFTDIVMPGGTTGGELTADAKRRRPNLRTLLTSGYTENAVVHQGRLEAGTCFLQKPFRRQDLAIKIREALDA